MKKISLFVVASSAALMTACTDYVSKIEDLHEERSIVYEKKTFYSGCTCQEVNEGTFVEAYGKNFFNTSSGLSTVTFALTGCSEMPTSVYRKSSNYDNLYVNSVGIYNAGSWWIELDLTSTAKDATLPGSIINYLDVYNAEGAEDLVVCPEVNFGYKAPEADDQQTSTTTNTSTSASTTQYGTFGTCAPNTSSVLQNEQVTWTFKLNNSSGLKAADIAKANISWNMPGGSPSTYAGGASTTARTKYAIAGSYAATASVTAGGVTQRVTCSSVTVRTSSFVCGDLWCGLTDTQGQVYTGYEDIEETSGYWYQYTDKDYEGTSAFTYPADVEANEYDNFYGPLVEAYGGLKGSVTLGAGYDYPFAGLAFNIKNERKEGVDISAWGGICLVYQSTVGLAIQLEVEDDVNVTEYNNYKVAVPKSATMTVADFPWAKFKQELGWGKTVSQGTVLADVATIKLHFSGSAGTSGDFLIQSLGRAGTCN